MKFILAAGAVLIPVIYSGGLDVFNLPKELVFRAEAIALLAAGVFWMTSKARTWKLGASRNAIVLAAVIVAWAAITTATSTNRLLSADTLLTIAAAAVIFVATLLTAQTTSIGVVDVLMFGACANAALVILQELKIWSPFVHAAYVSGHYASVGFLGNTNYVGTFLAAPALAAIVVAIVAAGKRRWVYVVIAGLLVTGLALSASRAAVVALLAGLVVLVARLRRGWLVVAGALAVVALMTLSPKTVLGIHAREMVDAASKRDYERLFSERLLPALAAVDMIRDHPLLGVGPGCFHYQFMGYRLRLDERYPKAWTRGYPGNWGAAHNDHLQVAAETGLPGYALFLAAIGIVAGLRRRGAPVRVETSFARALRWPLAALALVLCIAQFPLELAAPRLMFISLGALCITWDEDDDAA